MVRFQVLGPLGVERVGEAVDLGSYKQRALLALLLIHRNQVVPLDRILDDLWGEDAAVDRKGALHVYVSNLRTALEPDRERRSEGSLLLTRSPGYVLVTSDAQVDADEFDDHVRTGRALMDADPAAASIAIGEALAEWRGLPYQDFTYERWAQAEVERLTEARLSAVESRLQADLNRGMAGELVSELGSLVREHPLRERFSAQLMIALYRSGRQAEALRTYRVLSERLAEELGITPSTGLRRLEERIVMADPDLMVLGAAAAVTTTTRTVRGYELREEIGRRDGAVTYRAYQASVGRQVAVKEIGSGLADDPDFVRRFEDDARRVSHLRSEHIVPVYDYWREPGAAYLVERLMLGGTLADRLDGTPVGRDAIIDMVEAIGDALGAAHHAGLAHGDLRPSNVLFDSDGIAYVAGFRIGEAATVPVRSGAALTVSPDVAGEDQAAFAACVAQALAGREGAPPELMVGMDPDLAAVLGRATGPLTDRYPDVDSFTGAVLNGLLGSSGGPSRTSSPINPYKGLRAFEQTDAADFFGREREIERLIARIADPHQSSRFVAVVGPSGSGKSSLVKAGLIPALQRDGAPASRSWFAVEMVPGRYPFEALEDALVGIAFDPPASMLPLLTGENGIGRTVERILPDDDSQLVLVVDQLEELFTHTDPATANLFLSSVAASVNDPRSRLRVVCTLRADFYDRPLLHPTFGELLRRGTEVITPMSPTGLEHAITGPAHRVGVEVDQALVAEIVADVVERPAALPLMQYALTEMFDVRERNVIPASAYHQVGGVLGALVQRAEGIFATLDDDSKAATQQLFLRLVTLGEHGEQDTRRRALVTELTALGSWGASIQSVLDVYGHHRLLTFDRDLVTRSPTVEISHEALITEWGRLTTWIEEARSDMRLQRRLAAAMIEWEEADRLDDYLLAGGVLQQTEGWAASSTVRLTDAERAFLDASIARRDHELAERAAAEGEHLAAVKRSRRRAQMLGAMGLVAVIVAVLAGYAWYQRDTAKEQAAIADASAAEAQRYADTAASLARDAEALADATVLADHAVRQTASDPTLAMLLALQAAHEARDLSVLPAQVEMALHSALQSGRVAYPPEVEVVQTMPTAGGSAVGFYEMQSGALAAHVISHVGRGFTSAECLVYDVNPCPRSSQDIVDPAGLPPIAVREPGTIDGTTISVAHSLWDPSTVGNNFEAELERFEQATGVTIRQRVDSFSSSILAESIGALDPIDVGLIPQPGGIYTIDEQYGLIDVGPYLDQDLAAVYGPYVEDLVTIGSKQVAVPVKVDLKGLVWYEAGAFADAGYQVPSTWDEMLALSDQIVADGGTPWCMAFGGAMTPSGWPGTDWIEALLLRVADKDTYDNWMNHEVPFDHPDAVRAASMLEDLMATEGYVLNGRGAISVTPWFLATGQLLTRDGAHCWMMHRGIYEYLPALDFFVLPGLAGGDAPLFGGGVMAAATTDRPEVRAFMRFLAGTEFGREWAAGHSNFFISPRLDFDARWYGPEGDGTADLHRRAADLYREMTAADLWRFDASDFMPLPIGGVYDNGPGAFWYGVLTLANGYETLPGEGNVPVGAEMMMREVERAWTYWEEHGSVPGPPWMPPPADTEGT